MMTMLANVKVTIGEHEIVSSGQAIVPDKEYLQIAIDGLTYRLDFFTDISKSSLIELKIDADRNVMFINIFNMNSAIGHATTHPMRVGTYHGKGLFLSLYVFALGGENPTRLINYMFSSAPIKET